MWWQEMELLWLSVKQSDSQLVVTISVSAQQSTFKKKRPLRLFSICLITFDYKINLANWIIP